MKNNFKLNIQVTQKDFLEGKMSDCEQCPVALATTRALKKEKIRYHFLRVYPAAIDLSCHDGVYEAVLTSSVQEFIHIYDQLPKKTAWLSKYIRGTTKFTPFKTTLFFKKIIKKYA